jgi:erythromycin esterase-like protein
MRAVALATACLWAALFAIGAHAETPPADPTAADVAALNAATADACDRHVVVLGEVGTHGDGHAIAFKAALVHRLIAQCGFKAVLWESSFYEFDHLDRTIAAGTPVSRAQVAAAIGGLWNTDASVQPLIDELTDRANRHDIRLGGFDDIWDMAGVAYTTDVLPNILAARLAPPEAKTCADAFHTRIYNSFSPDMPGAAAAHQGVVDCLAHIRNTIPATDSRDIDLLDSLQRYIGSETLPQTAQQANSERSMYLNLRRLIDRLPSDAKVVVWTATTHGAFDTVGKDGAETKRMGGYIHKAFGDRALVIAISAAGGHYGLAGSPRVEPIPIPATGSVEALALKDMTASAVYVAPARLKSFGTVPAGLLSHSMPTTRDWSTAVDAAVILRDEYPVPHIVPAAP